MFWNTEQDEGGAGRLCAYFVGPGDEGSIGSPVGVCVEEVREVVAVGVWSATCWFLLCKVKALK